MRRGVALHRLAQPAQVSSVLMAHTLGKLTAAATITAVLVTGCARGSEPNPKPRKTAAITAPAVVICVNAETLVRHKDSECTPDGGLVWIYVQNLPMWSDELPAVGERLEAGRGDWAKPHLEIANVPDAGGFFA